MEQITNLPRLLDQNLQMYVINLHIKVYCADIGF